MGTAASTSAMPPPTTSDSSDIPVPPPSRAIAHVGGLLLAAVGGPIAWLAASGATGALGPSLVTGHAVPGPAVIALLLAAVIASLIAWWCHRSSAGAATAGAVCGAVGIAVVLVPDISGRLTALVPMRVWDLPVRTGSELLLATHAPLVAGLALGLGAAAASAARRRGRRAERLDHQQVAESGAGAAPRSRLAARIGSGVVGLAAGPLTLGAATALALTATWGDASPILPIVTAGEVGTGRLALLVGAVVLTFGLTTGIATVSAVGTAVAGAVWTLAGATFLLAPTRGTLLAPVIEPVAAALLGGEAAPLRVLDAFGISAGVGLVLIAGALGAHGARTDGRRTERSERAHTRTRRRPA